MKKSEVYKCAMASVIRDDAYDMEFTLEILDVLMEDKRSALWSEEREAKKEAAKNEAV